MIGSGPFQELDPRDRVWFNPDALLHLFRGEALSPSARLFLGKIDEGTLIYLQVLNSFEDISASCRDEACPYTSGVDQIFATIEPTMIASIPKLLGV